MTNQKLIDAVIEDLKTQFEVGDYTVLEELLTFVPDSALVNSLPEERWEEFTESGEEESFLDSLSRIGLNPKEQSPE